MKLATKTLFAALATTGLTAGSASAAILLGGFDGGTSQSFDATDDAVVQDASAVGNVDVTISGVTRQRGISISPLWGSTALTPAAETGTDVAVNNDGNWTLTFVVTNTGAFDVTLEEFHVRTRRDATDSDDSATFTYTGGDLGAVASTEIDLGAAFAGPTVGSEVDLGTLLSDSTLSAGESATFTLQVEAARSGAWVRVDNVAFSGEIVPEPGSLALLGLGGLCLIKRRRKA